MAPSSRVEAAAWLLLIPAIASYLGMNFTGASTYTSLSGVREEMRWAVPLQVVAAVLGVILWIVACALA
jgi:acetyl-CoA decarbonylase/synthase complex subunit gamma